MYRNLVKVEHLPTGMTAVSDSTRSQIKNLRQCMSVLRGKLWHLEHGTDVTEATEAQRAIADRIMRERVAPAPGGMIHDESRASGAVRQSESQGA